MSVCFVKCRHFELTSKSRWKHNVGYHVCYMDFCPFCFLRILRTATYILPAVSFISITTRSLIFKNSFIPKFHWHFIQQWVLPSWCEMVLSDDKKVSHSVQKNKSNQVTRQVKSLFSFLSKVEQEVRHGGVSASRCKCHKHLTTKMWNFCTSTVRVENIQLMWKKLVCHWPLLGAWENIQNQYNYLSLETNPFNKVDKIIQQYFKQHCRQQHGNWIYLQMNEKLIKTPVTAFAYDQSGTLTTDWFLCVL